VNQSLDIVLHVAHSKGRVVLLTSVGPLSPSTFVPPVTFNWNPAPTPTLRCIQFISFLVTQRSDAAFVTTKLIKILPLLLTLLLQSFILSL